MTLLYAAYDQPKRFDIFPPDDCGGYMLRRSRLRSDFSLNNYCSSSGGQQTTIINYYLSAVGHLVNRKKKVVFRCRLSTNNTRR